MLNEKYNILAEPHSRTKLKNKTKEEFNWNPTGYIVDKITNVKTGTIQIITGYNIVVDECSRLIAALLKEEEGINGIQYWAVGEGNSDWDDLNWEENAPEPSNEANQLLNEQARKPHDSISFIDAVEEETGDITNRLLIQVTFSEGEANYSLREFGLFGGDASSDTNSGIMINHYYHPVITKTEEMILERNLILTL